MKKQFTLKTLVISFSCVFSMLASAANVSLTANDDGGNSSLVNPGKWSDGAAPNPTNDYFTSTFFLRTPVGPADGSPTNITFAGHSLTLQTPDAGSQGAPLRSIIFKGSSNSVTIINNLTNSGGNINCGSGNILAIFRGNLMTVASNSTIQADQGPIEIDYPLAGSADLTNTSGQARTLTYTGDNSKFTGRFIINSSITVAFNSISNVPGNPSVPTPSQFFIGSGCTLMDNAGITYTNSNGGITIGDTTNGSVTINASATNASGAYLPTTLAVPIVDNGSNTTLIKRGLSILTLSASNSFSGGLTLLALTPGSQPQLNINNPNALGTGLFTIGDTAGAGADVTAAILDNASGSPITLAGNNPQLWTNGFGFIFLGSSSLNMGSGTITLATNINVTVSNNNLTVGPISDLGLGYSLAKSGPGSLTLSGSGSFTGATTISNGVLALTGSGSLNSSNISLASSAATLDLSGVGGITLAPGRSLGGFGTVIGPVTAGGGTIIVPGGNGAAGTLTFNGSLTLSGGSLNFDLASDPTPGGGTNDLIVATTLNLTSLTTINVSGSPANGNFYTLIQYGTFTGNIANLSVPGFVVSNDTTAHTIQLTKVHVPTNLTWHGDGSANVWDAGITPNWLQSGTPVDFFTGDSVTFDNSGSASPPVNLSGFISPAATVVNASQNYDFTGSGILSGTLTKAGSGTLILDNPNVYSGFTTINGGVLQVGNADTSGTLGSGPITNNASLVFNRTDAISATNSITGSGALAQSGTGDLTLSASNTFTGTMTVNSGRLLVQNLNAMGNGNVVVANNAQIYLLGPSGIIPPNPMTLNGSGSAGDGALRKGNQTTNSFGGAITLGSDTTLNVDGNGSVLNLTSASGISGNANLTLTGAGAGNITGPLSLGSGNLTVSGGTWTVAPANNYSGLTTINAGALLITGPLSLGQLPASFNPSQVTLGGGALGAAANVTLNDGKIGIFVNDNSSASAITVNSNATFAISNDIGGDGSATLTKTGAGTLILNGTNDFGGILNIDGNSTSANDGTTVIANTAAIANIFAFPGSPQINIRNNNGGSSTLALDGSSGSVTIAPDIGFSGRNAAVPAIENLAGNNVISGNFTLNVGGTFYIIQSDSGTLTLSPPGAIPFATPNTGRAFTFQGNGNILVSGAIQNGSLDSTSTSNVWVSVIKNGSGLLNLSAANTYSGGTVVSNGVLSLTGSLASGADVAGGLLVGTGPIIGPVTVESGGAIEAGDTNTIGTLNLGGSLSLSGNTIAKINKTAATSDLFTGQSSVTYGGTLTVTNLGGTLALGDSFVLFSPGASAGGFANIVGSPGPNLHYSFTNGVLSVATGAALATNPTNITVSVSGSQLTLSWPSDHLGWILQAQTNALTAGLGPNWMDVPNSASVTSTNITIIPSNPTVFYRLRYPN